MAGYKHLEIVQDFEKYVKDKKSSAKAYYRYLLTRLLRMFQYKNLPDSIPHEILDRYLFENGIALITKVNDKLRVFYGNLGGPQDVYYRPTTFIVANPHLKVKGEIFSANIPVFECETDDSVGQPIGVLMRNDTDWIGLHPLISRYAYLMSENTLTLRTADVMLRIIALLTAKTDKERASAIEYLKSIEKGELGVIGESSFHEGVDMQSPPSNNGSYLTQFIEYQQYLKGSFYNEIGLSANYNMKREAIGKGESTLDEDALLPLCDNMLKCRQEDIQRVNEMFGTNISVEFSSSWLTNRIETLSLLGQQATPTPAPFGSGSTPFDQVGQPIDGAVPSSNPDGDAIDVDSGFDKGSTEQDSAEQVREDVETAETAETGSETAETGNDDSTINDLSVDAEVTEILDNVVDKIENPEQNMLVNPLVEGGEDNADADEESSEDKADTSAD